MSFPSRIHLRHIRPCRTQRPRQAVQSLWNRCLNDNRFGQLVPLFSIKRAEACTDRCARFIAGTGGAARPFGVQSLHENEIGAVRVPARAQDTMKIGARRARVPMRAKYQYRPQMRTYRKVNLCKWRSAAARIRSSPAMRAGRDASESRLCR